MQPDDRSESEIEQLLVTRWVYRGGIIALLAVFAALLTILGGRGLTTLPEQIAAGLLVVCGVAAAVVFVVMRRQDHAMLRALRGRRKGPSGTGAPPGPGGGR